MNMKYINKKNSFNLSIEIKKSLCFKKIPSLLLQTKLLNTHVVLNALI
jgi:hypothetical protein